jgi:hypothetical protein
VGGSTSSISSCIIAGERKRFCEIIMPAVLSLTCQQVERLCEEYHQTLTLASSLEMIEEKLAKQTKRLRKSDVHRLRPFRTFLMIVKKEVQSRQEGGGEEGLTTKGLARKHHRTTRTIQEDLARLREFQLIQANPTGRGRWGKPKSRTTGSGRPPLLYVMNPQLRGRDYIMNDDVQPSDRKFLSLTEKLLLRMPGFVSASERICDAFLNIVPQLSEFMNVANENIPELRELLSLLKYDKPPAGLERLSYMIGAEIAASGMLELRIPIDGETLSFEERRRLEVCWTHEILHEGVGGGRDESVPEPTDSTRGPAG